jgi:hypothetical protein
MNSRVEALFRDEKLIKKIQNKLPKLFHIAELESSRAGRVGMEVGSLRERIIVALMIYKFGVNNVETYIPITEPEVDVVVFGTRISIKTVTGTSLSGVKLIWTVDAEKAMIFLENYIPSCDMFFVLINWSGLGGFYYIPQEVQFEIFQASGRSNYLKLPKIGTNPRGVEISSSALRALLNHNKTCSIPIEWGRETVNYDAFGKWVELWQEE